MKKVYMYPKIVVVDVEVSTFLCNSRGIRSTKGIDYGGMDEDDEYEPE